MTAAELIAAMEADRQYAKARHIHEQTARILTRSGHPENARDNVAAAKRLAWYGTTETSVVRAVG